MHDSGDLLHREGQQPRLYAADLLLRTPSLSGAEDFWVTASNVLNYRSGMLIWRRTPSALPFEGGTLSIGAPIHSTAVHHSGGNSGPEDCSGTYAFLFTPAYIQAHHMFLTNTFYAQYLSRDPQSEPFDVGLTDAVEFTSCP